MRDILDLFENKSEPEITEEHIPVEEDIVGKRGSLLSDLASRSKAKHADELSPKRKREMNAEYRKFMSEEELDEAMSPLKQAAMAAAFTGALAGGAKATQIHHQHQAAQPQISSDYAASAPSSAEYERRQAVGDRTFNQGDWAFNGSVEGEPEQAKPSIVDRVKSMNPFHAHKEGSFKSNLSYLTATIWGEARNQGDKGMSAVGHVIKNRMETGHWGDTIEDVVTAPKQFSCWNQGDPNLTKINEMRKIDTYIRTKPKGFEEWYAGFKNTEQFKEYQSWRQARKIAIRILKDESSDPTNGAKYYHTKAVNPIWNRGQQIAANIGDHLFYKSSAKKPS